MSQSIIYNEEVEIMKMVSDLMKDRKSVRIHKALVQCKFVNININSYSREIVPLCKFFKSNT
jgi:hypothetical protein